MERNPTTYAEWVVLLNQIKEGTCDSELLTRARNGSYNNQTAAMGRWIKRFVDVVDTRVKTAHQQFSLSYSKANRNEAAMVSSLLTLRREYQFLIDVCGIPSMPEKEKQDFFKQIVDIANKTQESLERSASIDLYGKYKSIVQQNGVNKLRRPKEDE